jgi:nucleoside-diphosphate-sugar epimerase
VKVLVTGADGYIGSVLTPYLADRGHEVTGLDTGFYRAGWLYDDGRDHCRVLSRDIRRVTADDLKGYDAVVHLAELSNDPLGAHNPEITYDINFNGSMNVARQAKAAGVPRFVYASSCSVYGAASDGIKTETSAPNPQTAYADCKVRCEKGLAELTAEDFVTTCLRNATAFGASPRMRFDIVLNNLAALAWTTGQIAMTSDGTPWRPLVHILDICQAIDLTLKAPADRVRGEIFNVGDDEQNYRVREIADLVAAAFPGCTTTFGDQGADNRSYQVSFAKIRKHLPDFKCQWSAERGARQLYNLFSGIGMTPQTFNAPPFTRINELKVLTGSGRLDPFFAWTPLDLDGLAPQARVTRAAE